MGPLDELQRLLGARGPAVQPIPSRPAAVEMSMPAPGGGLLDLTPAEWVALMRPIAMQSMEEDFRPPMRAALPLEDEVIRAPLPENWRSSDTGIVARPYTGPQTGDPVINQRRIGTWDRAPGLVNDLNRPFVWDNWKRFFGQ